MANKVDAMIGDIIYDKRRAKRLTQTQLAEMCSTTTQCIFYYEKGKRGMSVQMFFKICDALDLNSEEIRKQINYKQNH